MSQERGPYRNIRKAGMNKYGPGGIDVKEQYLKGEIMRQGQESTLTFDDMGSAQGGPSAQIIQSGGSLQNTDDVYMYFDSLAKGTSNLSQGSLSYNVSNLNNGLQPLSNVVSITLGDFYFPRIVGAAGAPDYFFFGKVYLQIQSTTLPSAQSVLAQDGNRYHFEFDIETLNSVAIKLTPVKSTYYFQRPIQSISDITFNFMVPPSFRHIDIPTDTIVVQALAGTNPAQFTVIDGSTTSPIGPVGVPVAPGVAIYLRNFNSASNTLNNTVNRNDGYFVDNIISVTNFSVSTLDLSTLAVNTECTVIIAKNRIAIEARFKSMRSQSTNGLVATNV
jgi:hypothetical protein